MDPNNNPFNTQNSANYPFNYQNSNNHQLQNQSPNQQRPQNVPNYGFAPNFNMSSVPNFHSYYGSTMPYPSQESPFNTYMSMGSENAPSAAATEFPEFSTQLALGGMADATEVTPNAEEKSRSIRKKSPKWTTEQNLVLISGWIKYGTNAVVGRNQKSEAYWGSIAEYCNEHCSFDPPRDILACRNRFNYINKILSKWVGAYDHAKRVQSSGWSENDVLEKAKELFLDGKTAHFNLMAEWHAIRDQPRYISLLGGNTGSQSSGSKRSHESDACDSNSVASIARPMGRDASKKKGKKKSKETALEENRVNWSELFKFKEKELERLDNIAIRQEEAAKRQEEAAKRQEEANQKQEEANQLQKEKTEAKRIKMFMKLNSMEDPDDRSKELLERLSKELFGN